MLALVYAIYWLSSFALLIWALYMWRKARSLSLALAAFVLAGICYDTLLIASGRLIGTGSLLMALSWPRYLIHALQTPLLLVVVVDLAQRAGLGWASQNTTRIAVWMVTAGLMALGIATDVVGLELEPHLLQGTLRYAEPVTVPPIATIAVIILLVLMGGLFWRGTRQPWLFAATLFTLFSGGVPTTLVGPALTSGAEIVLLGCLLAVEHRLAQKRGIPAVQQSEVPVMLSVGER